MLPSYHTHRRLNWQLDVPPSPFLSLIATCSLLCLTHWIHEASTKVRIGPIVQGQGRKEKGDENY